MSGGTAEHKRALVCIRESETIAACTNSKSIKESACFANQIRQMPGSTANSDGNGDFCCRTSGHANGVVRSVGTTPAAASHADVDKDRSADRGAQVPLPLLLQPSPRPRPAEAGTS